MSLRISPFKRNTDDGKMEFISMNSSKHLGGFESYRTRFWGAKVMVQLGLELLPTLGDGVWLVIENDDLDNLESEARIISNNLNHIAEMTKIGAIHVENYANNLLHAITIARDANGGVSIG